MKIFTDEHLANIGAAAIRYMAAKESFEHYKLFERDQNPKDIATLVSEYHNSYKAMRDAMVEGII